MFSNILYLIWSAIHLSLWLLSNRNASQESSPEQGAGSPIRSKHKKMFLSGEAFLTPHPIWLLCCLLKSMGMPHLFSRGIYKLFFLLSLFLFWSKNPRGVWAKYLWDIHLPHQLSWNWLTDSQVFLGWLTRGHAQVSKAFWFYGWAEIIYLRDQKKTMKIMCTFQHSHIHTPSVWIVDQPSRQLSVILPKLPQFAINPELGRLRLLLSFIPASVPCF